MVTYYGMSEKLPNISYYDPQRQMGDKPYSDERARIIDEEITRIVNEQYQRAKDLLTQYSDGLHKIVDLLMEKEVILAADVEQIFGKRPWISRTEQLMKEAEKRKAAQAATEREAEPTEATERPAEPASENSENSENSEPTED